MNTDKPMMPRRISAEEARKMGTAAWMIRGEDFIHHFTYAKGA